VLALTAQAKPARKPKLMMLDLPPDEAFKPNEQKAFNDFEAGALRDQGFDVITSADVAAVLGVEKQKELLGCGESSCLTELGGAMGADYIVRGNLASVGPRVALTMTMVDSHGHAINEVRSSKIGSSAPEVLDAIERLVPDLVAPARPVRATPPVAAPGPAAPEVVVKEATPAGRVGPGPTSYALWGVGAAAGIGSGVTYALAWSSFDQLKTAVNSGPASKVPSLRSSTQGFNDASAACLGVAVVAAGVGTVIWLMSPSSAAPPTTPGTVALRF
jgi:hypothetical protein